MRPERALVPYRRLVYGLLFCAVHQADGVVFTEHRWSFRQASKRPHAAMARPCQPDQERHGSGLCRHEYGYGACFVRWQCAFAVLLL